MVLMIMYFGRGYGRGRVNDYGRGRDRGRVNDYDLFRYIRILCTYLTPLLISV